MAISTKYKAVNLLKFIDSEGEDAARAVLSAFICGKNKEVESFVRYQAIDFAKRKISMTYLIFDEEGNLLAIFILTHKAIDISGDTLSNTARKRLKRFSTIDESTNSYTTSAFLIAQLGKNYANGLDQRIRGDEIMDCVFTILEEVQSMIGGGIVYLECEDKPQLLSFYRNGKYRFFDFPTRYSADESTKYIQLLRFF